MRPEWGAPRRRTVTWHDPAVLARAAAEMSGRELLEAIGDGRLPGPPLAELFGARLEFVGDGEVRFRCTPSESEYNTLGLVAGGLLCVMLDFAAGAAVHSLLPRGVGLSSIEIKVSYLKPVRAGAGDVEVHGKALRVGKRVAFAEAFARNGDGQLVGHATSSVAVLQPPT